MSDVQTREQFVARYGGIYEHSAWVAEAVYDNGGADDDVAGQLRACVDSATYESKLALIRAHPELAGKEAQSGGLTSASANELPRASRPEQRRWGAAGPAPAPCRAAAFRSAPTLCSSKSPRSTDGRC